MGGTGTGISIIELWCGEPKVSGRGAAVMAASVVVMMTAIDRVLFSVFALHHFASMVTSLPVGLSKLQFHSVCEVLLQHYL
jgi:hypothetical protein